MLLIGCYSAILLPAYFPLDKTGTVSDDYQHPRDLVRTHMQAATLGHFFSPTKLLSMLPLSLGLNKSISLPALKALSASLVSEPPEASVLLFRTSRHPCVCAAGQICTPGSAPSSGAPGHRRAFSPCSGFSASAWPAPITEARRELQTMCGGWQWWGSSWEPSWISYRSV